MMYMDNAQRDTENTNWD